MDKATKVAVEKYPHGTFDGEVGDSLRAACAVGYMQAEKDTIERACEYLFKHNAVNLDEFRKAMEE